MENSIMPSSVLIHIRYASATNSLYYNFICEDSDCKSKTLASERNNCEEKQANLIHLGEIKTMFWTIQNNSKTRLN